MYNVLRQVKFTCPPLPAEVFLGRTMSNESIVRSPLYPSFHVPLLDLPSAHPALCSPRPRLSLTESLGSRWPCDGACLMCLSNLGTNTSTGTQQRVALCIVVRRCDLVPHERCLPSKQSKRRSKWHMLQRPARDLGLILKST